MPRKDKKGEWKRAKWNREKKPGRPTKKGRPLQLLEKVSLIYGFLPENDSKRSAAEFKKLAGKSGMGFDTLYKYLKELLDLKFVIREFDESKYPPLVYYRRSTSFWLGGKHPLLRGKFGDLQAVDELLVLNLKLLRDKGERKYSALIKRLELEVRDGIEGKLAAIACIRMEILEQTGKIEDSTRREEYAAIASQLYVEPIIQDLVVVSPFIRDIAYSTDYSFVKRARRYCTTKNLGEKRKLADHLAQILGKESRARNKEFWKRLSHRKSKYR